MFSLLSGLKAKAYGWLKKAYHSRSRVFLPGGLIFSFSKREVLWQLVLDIANSLLLPFAFLKSRAINFLMKRGGFFSNSSRLGLSSLISLALFSLVILPQFQKAKGQEFVNFLLSTPMVTGESDFLISQNPIGTEKAVGSPSDDIINYSVQPNDSLWSIGKRFSVSSESLAYVNNLSDQNLLSVGQTIKIPPVEGLIHSVGKGDTVSAIAQKYSVDPQAIVDFNYLEAPYALNVGQTLIIPNATVPHAAPVIQSDLAKRGGLEIAPGTGVVGSGKLLFPTSGIITQYFSWYHPAIDIANASSPAVNAADSGTVTFAGWWAGGGGNSVWIDHGNGMVTKYAHLNQIYVAVGQGVSRGQSVGQMGQTGRAYGIHTHFIVEQNGRAVNPLSVL